MSPTACARYSAVTPAVVSVAAAPPTPFPGVSGDGRDVSIVSTKQRHGSCVQVAWAGREIHPIERESRPAAPAKQGP